MVSNRDHHVSDSFESSQFEHQSSPIKLGDLWSTTQPELSDFVSVNFHLTKYCNYKCRFCFAHFADKSTLAEKHAKSIIGSLVDHGMEKITFVGGEPTLVPFLPNLLKFSKQYGLTTMIVTNGTRINDKYLRKVHQFLDWIGLSIDSSFEEINKVLGRGTGRHVDQTRINAKRIREYGLRLKVNTVVTSLTWKEDMSGLLDVIQPDRWKVFQMLPIIGENDDAKDLLVTTEQYQSFLTRHKQYLPVGENNDLMTGSYVMIDPDGRFFSNTNGFLEYSQPIHEVGIIKAFDQIKFSLQKLKARNGYYQWGEEQ